MSEVDGVDRSAVDASAERAERREIAQAVASRRRAQMVSGLRGLTKPGGLPRRGIESARDSAAAADPAGSGKPSTAARELCDLCGTTIPQDHRHLLHLLERRIVCSCEACWAMRAAEADYRPVGSRTVWLDDMDLPDEVWASFQIPIGLAFFMGSTVTSCVVAMYPSPGGATESELHFDSWKRLVALNPVLAGLEPDVEGLIVNRLADPPIHVIAPIDRCYELTGTIKLNWEGISGGDGIERAVSEFFQRLRGETLKVELAKR
jgi:Family of unknown function (DUF5947)